VDAITELQAAEEAVAKSWESLRALLSQSGYKLEEKC